jgi:hypothetical protein
MVLTRSFKELVQSRAVRDKRFADALLKEGVDTLLAGDVESGKLILRDYIKATVGFEKLAEAIDTPAKSLIRMFGPAIRKREICLELLGICRSGRRWS